MRLSIISLHWFVADLGIWTNKRKQFHSLFPANKSKKMSQSSEFYYSIQRLTAKRLLADTTDMSDVSSSSRILVHTTRHTRAGLLFTVFFSRHTRHFTSFSITKIRKFLHSTGQKKWKCAMHALKR